MTCLADATLAMRFRHQSHDPDDTTERSPLESHGGGEEEDIRDGPQQRDSDQSQLKKGLPPPLGPPFVDQLMCCSRMLERSVRSSVSNSSNSFSVRPEEGGKGLDAAGVETASVEWSQLARSLVTRPYLVRACRLLDVGLVISSRGLC